MKPSYKPILATFERLADSYGFRQGMEEVNRCLLAPLVSEWEGRILDVGAGTGTLIGKYLNPGKNEVYTVDFSWNMLKELEKNLGHEFGRSLFPVRSIAQSLPFARDSFDAALSVNTLHNMPSWKDICESMYEMARVLRPRGTLLLEFRNWDNPHRRRICEMYDLEDLPQKAFTIERVENQLRSMGFDVLKVMPLWGEYVPSNSFNNLLERMSRSMKRMPKNRAPRFAVLAEKGPAFKTLLRDAMGHPVFEQG
ncbi:MAG TPA: class I SAM-dependent methyltransferase [bacterium]|nr:class I SAM-dependent methyltransferase [bacterium]